MDTYGQPIIPNHHFSYALAESQLLFKDGHYFGCIALCQSVAEALARFMYEKWTGKRPSGNFETNIHRIKSANVQPDVGSMLTSIYGGHQRHDFHHLNKTVLTEIGKLKTIATEKIDLLNKVESLIFENEYTELGLKPKYPKYWPLVEGGYEVFIKTYRP